MAVRSALSSVGFCFGSLHPLTSLKLYHSLSLPIMLNGSQLRSISKTELLFLERVHRKILRMILGRPTRCSSFLSTLLEVNSIDTSIQQKSLGFIVATANVPSDSVARRILAGRAASNPKKGVVKYLLELLAKQSLTSLLSTPPLSSSPTIVKKHLSITACLDFCEVCDAYHSSFCDLKPPKPAPHLAVTIGKE